MGHSMSVDIADEAALQFVCAVTSQHLGGPSERRFVIYLGGDGEPRSMLIAAMQRAVVAEHVTISIDPQPSDPPPDVAFHASASPGRKGTKKSPYLFGLFIQARDLPALATQLLPRYWSIHPAYEMLRAARRAKVA
jgi:hypothetical protein